MSDANSETSPVTQTQPPQNGKERSKSTEEKEIPREPALTCKDINVSLSPVLYENNYNYC